MTAQGDEQSVRVPLDDDDPPNQGLPSGRMTAVRGWRWRIVGGRPLPVEVTPEVGEAIRNMLFEAARWSRGSSKLPLCLHGPTRGNTHARYLPEDADRDEFIDHLLVFASGGLDTVALRLLAISERLFVPGFGAHDLEPLWMGASPDTPLLARSKVWQSRVPYVTPPWHKLSIEEHIRKELPKRGFSQALADAVSIERLPWPLPHPNRPAFTLTRPGGEGRPSKPQRAFLRLSFPEPVDGPIILGRDSHFGLGQFVPAAEHADSVMPA